MPVNHATVVMPVTISIAITVGATPGYNNGTAAVVRRTVIRPVVAGVRTVGAIRITVATVVWMWPGVTSVVAAMIRRMSSISVRTTGQT
jgi:hypothetical protein